MDISIYSDNSFGKSIRLVIGASRIRFWIGKYWNFLSTYLKTRYL